MSALAQKRLAHWEAVAVKLKATASAWHTRAYQQPGLRMPQGLRKVTLISSTAVMVHVEMPRQIPQSDQTGRYVYRSLVQI